MRRVIVALSALAALAALLLTSALAASPVQHASATLIDVDGNVVGFATFVERPDGSVLVNVHASGLTPGQHGIHVHAVGECAPPFASALGHFNPGGHAHGAHAGDLGNVTANPAGRANMTQVVTQFTLSAGTHSLFDADGSALVIHAGPDDLVSDPAGNSGPRVICGVIERR
ncbi:MAG TPA: superoxide dismutase family protein [Thermomicrobiales bacterium]|nr:superoxide dismutase family protein [Thermomicrobiales bacterium]